MALLSRLSFLALALAVVASPARAADKPVCLVIVGDSTVATYPDKHDNRGWGQYIGEKFKDGAVRVVNLAAAGRSTKTFLSEGRWSKALAEKPDVVLIQFGHNDSHEPAKPEATEAQGDYKDNLRRYIDESRAAGAVPVLVTPMVRRTFDASGKFAEAPGPKSLGSFAAAMREVGEEKKVAVVDLYASSRSLAEELGPDKSGQMASRRGDITHFNERGARVMADLVAKGFPAAAPTLAPCIKAP